ncbi:MAG: hypothetical protein CSA50_07675 [Gammaproteobacteria bacterium]|nr:MAG: hypothetical protein CSA50_07675 [Gammaproteobacteria bacterium]
MFDFLFRVDADSSTGAGHLTRCIALAEGLRSRGYHIGFVGAVNSHLLRAISSVQVPLLSLADKPACRCLIIDSYLSLDFLLAPWPLSLPVVLIDDETAQVSDRPMLVVSPLGNAVALENHFPNAEVMTGVEYLFLRQQIKKARIARGIRNCGIERTDNFGAKVFITLGGSDRSRLLQRIAEILVESLDNRVEFTVFGNANGLRLQAENLSIMAEFSNQFIDLSAKQADLVICGAGQTLIEMSYIGVPVIGIVMASNQGDCGRVLSGSGIAVIDGVDSIDNIENDLLGWISRLFPAWLKAGWHSGANQSNYDFSLVRAAGSRFAQHQEQVIERICEMLR